MPLSDRGIRNFRPAERPYKKGDTGGLFLLVSPNGGRWWRFKYRFGGKAKLLSLGVFPEVSLAEARERRDVARKLLAQGKDPSAQRKQERHEAAIRDANSFEAVALEWHGKWSQRVSDRYASKVMRRLERDLFPYLGARPVSELDPSEVLDALGRMETRGAHDLAHRVLAIASQVFRYAVTTRRCKSDPTRDLRGALTPHKARTQAAVKQEELPDLLREIERYPERGNRQTALALRLLCLTFVRTSELIGATWDEFGNLDEEAPTWEIPAERMKMREAHMVPLSRQTVKVLGELRMLAGNSRYVLPGRNDDKPISNNTMLYALYRLGYKGKMTGHGFRAIASTALNESGWSPDVIERQLAHKDTNEIRRVYNRAEYMPERRRMMQAWADMVDACARGADVVPIRRHAS